MVFLLHITSTGKHFQDLLTSAIRWRARGKRSFPPASISRDLCELHNTDYLHGARWTPAVQANYKTLDKRRGGGERTKIRRLRQITKHLAASTNRWRRYILLSKWRKSHFEILMTEWSVGGQTLDVSSCSKKVSERD